MNYNDIRKTFLDYFESHGHKIVPSASLIPNDPTLLFTVAGMVPWKGILQGTEPAFAPRVADVQKCIRAGGKHNDLDEVGFDGRHHTFFEMLGNWSFGDYFKAGAIEMSWDLLTNVLKLDPARLRVTTHVSDDESTEIWRKVAGKEAIRLGDKDNWWSAGDTGPCGPCTEIFYDFGADIENEDDRWVEIWNDVFMQFDRDANGNLTPLPKQNVDTGAGLERWAALLQGKVDNYDTDLFSALISATEDIVGVKKTPENVASFKVIADHLRAVGFAIADGVIPSNTDRGYVIRRILRRAMRHGQLLGHRGALLSKLYPALITEMGAAYPELGREEKRVVEIIQNEENAFADMLQNGIKLLDNEIPKIQNNILPGEIAFKLFDTYGFPLDLTQMILREKNIDVDVAGFERAMGEQKERSRANTKGTRTLWESQTQLPATDDTTKYAPDDKLESKVLAILRDGEFVESASAGDDVEVALDKTNFYGTQGGQVGDSGELKNLDGQTVMNVGEAGRVDNIVIHKGTLTADLHVGDVVKTVINSAVRTQTTRAHTATHLLQAALRHVLNEDVEQRGSKVSPDSVRFDFSFGRPMTTEEKQSVEDLVNKWIDADMPVAHEEMSMTDAKSRGAMALFGEKYGDVVKVITAGDVSCELCGGTHVYHTGEIKHAKINKEKSISSGVRRITMSVGTLAE
ncbi:MAG: alanine--tRNA ligase [Proteobacteria bacterium]|uniref:Alanine--tRNA ligase n=1 Tax=Candidatus Enterousia avistercoris TaxID=2840788 RepID=A0A9D9DDR6_9PROT|nr:alanine--tRNA ligase [Candidatus Enterousia avistercoris]